MKITITNDIYNPCDIDLYVKQVTTIETHEILDSEKLTHKIAELISSEVLKQDCKSTKAIVKHA